MFNQGSFDKTGMLQVCLIGEVTEYSAACFEKLIFLKLMIKFISPLLFIPSITQYCNPGNWYWPVTESISTSFRCDAKVKYRNWLYCSAFALKRQKSYGYIFVGKLIENSRTHMCVFRYVEIKVISKLFGIFFT